MTIRVVPRLIRQAAGKTNNLEYPTLNTTSMRGELERRLTQALASNATVFTFERQYLEAVTPQYSQDIVSFCERLQRPLHHWFANDVSEESVARLLVRVDTAGHSGEETSLYRTICAALAQRKTGIFCIYDAEELSREGTALLSRLVKFVKENKLRWQFLLIGDFSRVSQMTLGMLRIDQHYPNAGESDVKPTTMRNEVDTSSRPPWWLGGLVLLVFFLIVIWIVVDHELATRAPENRPEVQSLKASELTKQSLLKSELPAPVSAMDAEFQQALRLANVSQIKRLLDDGRSVNSVNEREETGLIMAAQASDGALAKKLIAWGASVDFVDEKGHTALFYACLNNKSDIVADLIKAGANPNIHSELLTTPLIVSIRNGNRRISKRLLASGADPNWQDKQGWSPLFFAAWGDEGDLVELLIEYGARKDLVSVDGSTAADIARARNSSKVSELLAKPVGVKSRN